MEESGRKSNGYEMDPIESIYYDGKTCYCRDPHTCRIDFGKIATGETIEQLLEAYPRLTEEGIRADFRFAAQALRADAVYPISDKPHESHSIED